MNWYEITINNKEYRLRMGIRDVCALESQLGKNPVALISGDFPTVTEMVKVLHASLQKYHHGFGMGEVMELFEAWLEDGHAQTDFLEVMLGIFKVSGLLENDRKND